MKIEEKNYCSIYSHDFYWTNNKFLSVTFRFFSLLMSAYNLCTWERVQWGEKNRSKNFVYCVLVQHTTKQRPNKHMLYKDFFLAVFKPI